MQISRTKPLTNIMRVIITAQVPWAALLEQLREQGPSTTSKLLNYACPTWQAMQASQSSHAPMQRKQCSPALQLLTGR